MITLCFSIIIICLIRIGFNFSDGQEILGIIADAYLTIFSIVMLISIFTSQHLGLA